MKSAATRSKAANPADTDRLGFRDRPIIGWLELAVSSRGQDTIAAVHPIDCDEHQQCCGVTVDHRWLCGSDGTLTCFDTMTAATRFLNLLNIDRIARGGRRDCDGSDREAFQCFKLGTKGILPCTRCHSRVALHEA